MNKIGLICLTITVLLAGCIDQHDHVSITKSGEVTITTEISIAKNEFIKDFKEIESEVSKEVARLTRAGWLINLTWVSKTAPFKLRGTAMGSLAKISSTKYFPIKAINGNKFQIAFQKTEGNRDIRFEKSGWFSKVPFKITEEKTGKEITEVLNANRSNQLILEML